MPQEFYFSVTNGEFIVCREKKGREIRQVIEGCKTREQSNQKNSHCKDRMIRRSNMSGRSQKM